MAKRAYVIAIGIDKASNELQENPKATSTQPERAKYHVSFQLPNFAVGGSEGGVVAGGGSDKHIMFTVDSNTMFEAFRRLSLTSPWEPYFEHLISIVISEEVVADGTDLNELLDSFARQEQMRRNMKVFVTPGKAKDLLIINMPGPITTAAILDGIFKDESIGFSPSQYTIGNIMTILHQHGDFALPMVYGMKKNLVLGGAAVFRNGIYIGKIPEKELRAIRLIRGSLKSTVYDIPCPTHAGKSILFEAEKIETKIVVMGDDPQNTVLQFKIKLSGIISENQCKDIDPLSEETFTLIQTALAQKIEEDISSAFDYMIKNNVDLLGLKKIIWQQNPDLYRKFETSNIPINPTLPFQVQVEVGVRSTGLVRN